MKSLKGRLQAASVSISIVELVSVWTRGIGSSQEGFKPACIVDGPLVFFIRVHILYRVAA